MAVASELNGAKSAYRVHWHVLITHFPISFLFRSLWFSIPPHENKKGRSAMTSLYLFWWS
jgi:hypothetical protein